MTETALTPAQVRLTWALRQVVADIGEACYADPPFFNVALEELAHLSGVLLGHGAVCAFHDRAAFAADRGRFDAAVAEAAGGAYSRALAATRDLVAGSA